MNLFSKELKLALTRINSDWSSNSYFFKYYYLILIQSVKEFMVS